MSSFCAKNLATPVYRCSGIQIRPPFSKKGGTKAFSYGKYAGEAGAFGPFPPAPPSYTSFKAGVASAPGGECVAQRSRGGRAPYIYEGTEGTRI